MKRYWAFPQSPSGRWHVVIGQLERPARFPLQVTACGRTILQAEEWQDGSSREYLRDYACKDCLCRYPVPDEGTTLDGQPWPAWDLQGRPSPLFEGAR